MKLFLSLTVCVFLVFLCKAQKPVIDTGVFENWPSVGMETPKVSDDGRFCAYRINGRLQDRASTVVQSIKGNWKIEMKAIRNLSFTRDSRKLIYLNSKDTLSIRTLGTDLLIVIANVASFKLFVQGKTQWLLYQQKTADKELILQNLQTGHEQIFRNISSYLLSRDCSSLLLETQKQTEETIRQQLIWVDLSNNRQIAFWEGANAHSFLFDGKGRQLAFIVDSHSGTVTTTTSSTSKESSIWYYKVGEKLASVLADNKSVGMSDSFQIKPGAVWDFSDNGDHIFFTLHENGPKSGQNKLSVSMDVWSYLDPITHLSQSNENNSYAAALINCKTRQAILLEEKNEDIKLRNNNYAVVCHRKGDFLESPWNTSAEAVYNVIDFKTGLRRQIKAKVERPVGFSPNKKYLVFKDFDGYLYSYELANKKIVNISEKLPVSLLPEKYDIAAGGNPTMSTLAGWTTKEGSLLFYDKYDIWKFDLTGKNAPVNLTNGMGRKNNIVFRILQLSNDKPIISENQTVVLSAFNRKTKDAGYYKLNKQGGDPQLLYTGRFNCVGYPVKAAAEDDYLLFLESASKSPNLFHTSDFKTFKPLTAIYPEKDYNWLTSEVVVYKTLDGREAECALYKPENFNPGKKYPVIFNYYAAMSDEVNYYEKPEPAYAWINIPWFVSRGYIVCCPDTYSALGEPGIAAYNSVVGAAKHLTKFPWIDSTKMAIHGHSFAGFLNNYILTKTGIFSAALTSAGASDFISAYSLSSDKQSLESGQYRLGASIWENKKAYLDHSPVLQADQVTTPLLMLHNKEDGAVPFEQGVEFFIGLRRLGKRAWMLQYDGETHAIINENAAKDYTIRITQFFDHYLKDSAAPRWMLNGIPASQKGIDDGLDLVREKDLNGKWITPGSGLLRKETYKIY